ncbi:MULTISPECIES: MurR/RpiR family transcriptional regulator [Brucella/Ochrobactrum group]|uniref:MurR/RpiR family transcriptional regulator n=2 Tax=Ochrobactrum TaxID=528 RepID=A0ABD5JXH2_9HYPH|nr:MULTISPECIES: MurR/RpiR family transcriptional regulator [Brucella]MCI1001194.1 MurR/RpiR family transcriptional regulator [Ochrobactrum sp. C6C9]RRD24566.1 MurR/RpiR family transcriptional regulator [Brucellaceae bacterium VT-16-1752]WHT43211.1 MurR/RpiR family transcriptional regulator [Ochrobactrum sp. SSR]RLL74037.1 MurR/RpiR family transcriptional regulator [[Ochrobactrum] soli]WHS33107.1 MurR/RpiR family transcriptional regulator [Brucella sp. NM4]
MDTVSASSPAPTTVKEFEARLLEVSDRLPKRLKQCADFVAANQDRIAVSTVAEMADGAGVQSSAFMRFCQLLGFSGFSEMQKLFRESYAGGWPDYSTRLEHLRETAANSAPALLAEFAEAGRTSLEGLLKTIEPEALERAVEILARAETIHLVGIRRAFPVASYLAYALEKMQVPAMLHSAVGKLENMHAIRKGDVLLAITFSPYSAETVEMAESAAARGVNVVGITDTIVSPLSKLAQQTLLVSEVDFGAFRSLSATLCLAIALAVAVGTARQSG